MTVWYNIVKKGGKKGGPPKEKALAMLPAKQALPEMLPASPAIVPRLHLARIDEWRRLYYKHVPSIRQEQKTNGGILKC